jgi:Family of unknown function (DUF5677)
MAESAVDVAVKQAVESTTLSFQVMIDLEAFDKQFVQGVVTSLLKPSEREECFLVSYHRAVLNVRSIITLNNVAHFQAVAMLARSLFELAVEIRLIDVIAGSVIKMIVFQKLEKLKAALKTSEFASTHTLQFPTDLTPYHQFINSQQAGILAAATSLWGSMKVTHWSQKDLYQRTELLGEPFEEVYQSLYKQLSWHAHAGMAGAMNTKPEAFPYLFGVSCQIAALSYEEILSTVIKEFKQSNVMPTIERELKFAKVRSGAGNDPQKEAALRQWLGLPL